MISSGLSREIIAIFALYLSNLIDGMSWGYSSTAIPDIKREMKMENSTSFIPKISATDNQLSWFGKSKLLLEKEINKYFPLASSLCIGQMFGGLLGGYLGGKYGPKMTIQVYGVFASIGWLMNGFAPNLALLISGRVILGFAQCMNMTNNSLLLVQYRYIRKSILQIKYLYVDSKYFDLFYNRSFLNSFDFLLNNGQYS